MIRRAAQVIALLGGAEDENAELTAVAKALRASGIDPRDIADTLIDAFESEPEPASKAGAWGWTTAIGACFAAAGGALGLRALAGALLPAASFAWLLPLFAVPFALFALIAALLQLKANRADERERCAIFVTLALARLGIAPRTALDAGAAIAALEPERARIWSAFEAEASIAPMLAMRKSGLAIEASARRPSRKLAPAFAAVWAIGCFWILYFGTVATSMSKELLP